MKTLVKAFVLFVTTLVFAQNPIVKNVNEFTELKVYDLIEVELIKAKENKVEITGKNSENVIVNNKEGKLKIKMNFEDTFNGNDTKVKLYYSALDIIDVNEGAKVTSQETIKQFEIDLKAQEGGKINIELDVDYVNIKSITGGFIEASGQAKKQKINILTGGFYSAETLKTEDTEVQINAAGEAYINASNSADVKIRAGGSVFIYGNPKTVNESKVLGGKIKMMN